MNVITKSGGNLFSGSFRDTLVNDDWRALTPFAADRKVDDVLPAYEYTLGGPRYCTIGSGSSRPGAFRAPKRVAQQRLPISLTHSAASCGVTRAREHIR